MTPIQTLDLETATKAWTAERDQRDEARAQRAEERARKAEERAQKTARPAEMRNISRLVSGSTVGWTVRFQREGEKHGRFFKDAKHGGPDDALRAAQTWRDDQRQALGPTPRSSAHRMHTPSARQKNRQSVSQTGVTGIGVVAREFATQDVPYVTAYWIDGDGRRRQTSFSIGRHGVEGALRLAAEARARTDDWHGAPPMSADDLYEAALDAVRRIAEPLL